MKSSRLLVICAVLLISCLLSACSPSQEVLQERFCQKLQDFTGAGGAESALVAQDPARIATLIDELGQLHETAPEVIATQINTILNFFTEFQQAPRDVRRQLLVERQFELEQASAQLDKYALDECGLFLQRALPTPKPTAEQADEVFRNSD